MKAAGRSTATIKRHEAEFNAFAGFLEARGRAVPTEVDCLDFIAERSGSRLAGLREPTSSRRAQLARRPLLLLMETLAGGFPEVGQPTTPPVERCPARFRAARDEYLAVCRRRGNAEATVVTKQRAADQFLAYLEEVGRETLEQAQARDLAGFWARRQRRGYAPKTTGLLRTALADFLGHLHEVGQIWEDLARRLPPQRYPRRGQSVPHPWTAGEVRLVLEQIDRQSAIGLPIDLLQHQTDLTRRPRVRDRLAPSRIALRREPSARSSQICPTSCRWPRKSANAVRSNPVVFGAYPHR